ncbi:Tripartite tricarboxylate transporter TctB family protein [Methylobrevis pamukkalensis]|uniref:Tripartite tricarboxylate transporter TctB family protein n=1 Tax=Methylobrevis pamukkalensis TaxID=1439726 RepID=A0A1E3GWT2_9HYPH|nr:Tripartite tricarboxylate transporter TctB family protein [Methylobrevis pamukkalensis]
MNHEPGAEPTSRTERRRPDRAALAIAAGLAALGVVIFVDTARIGGAASYARVGPTVFPYVIATALLLLAAGTAVKAGAATSRRASATRSRRSCGSSAGSWRRCCC